MKKFLLILSIIFSSHALQAQLSSNKVNLIDSFINVLYAHDQFMGTITVYKNGEVLYDRQIGGGETEAGKWEADENSKYRIGSISKVFTSVMIFQLIDEGKLSLDTKLSKYYPEVKHADDISIRQMLNHHSGIYSFTSHKNYLKWNTEEHTKDEMLKIITKHKPAFKPGKKASYSNSNFILLGYIIEDIEGDTYANILKKRITDKLGLTHTYYGTSYTTNNTELPSYWRNDMPWKLSQETHMSVPHGAGALVSTSKELCVFMDGLFKGELLPMKWVDTMTTIEDGYGMGMFRFKESDTTNSYGHTGGIDGFVSMVSYNPHDSIVIGFSSNAMYYGMIPIVALLDDIIRTDSVEIPDFKSVKLTAAEAAKYTGNYKSKDIPLKIKIFYEDGKLNAQASGQSSFPLTQKEDGSFEFKPAGIVMTFEEDGKYIIMKLKQRGKTYTYRKKK